MFLEMHENFQDKDEMIPTVTNLQQTISKPAHVNSKRCINPTVDFQNIELRMLMRNLNG